jgi:hypothetical protein
MRHLSSRDGPSRRRNTLQKLYLRRKVVPTAPAASVAGK